MKLKNIGYAALVTVATAAFVLGTAGSSEAAKKKKAAAAPLPRSPICSTAPAPVCGVKGGQKFTYVNACFAGNDGASLASNKACPIKKAGKKKAKKAKK